MEEESAKIADNTNLHIQVFRVMCAMLHAQHSAQRRKFSHHQPVIALSAIANVI